MAEHVSDTGHKLAGSVDSYNRLIGSLERNVLSKARRLRDFGASKDGKALPEALDPIDLQPRALQVIESKEKDDAA